MEEKALTSEQSALEAAIDGDIRAIFEAEITPEEQEAINHLVETMRMQRARELCNKGIRIELLETALEYERWLQENGAGDTFSTFIDDYGYQGPLRSWVHKQIKELRNTATQAAQEVWVTINTKDETSARHDFKIKN